MFKARLLTILTAMMPVAELRAAIPVGVGFGLSLPESFVLSLIGNILPIPFVILFTRSIFAWLRTKSKWLNAFVSKMEARAEKNKEVVLKYQFWGLVLLVAIPLPGTGAWTGGMVAAMLDMQLKRAMPAIILGVLIAGIIVLTITYGAVKIF